MSGTILWTKKHNNPLEEVYEYRKRKRRTAVRKKFLLCPEISTDFDWSRRLIGPVFPPETFSKKRNLHHVAVLTRLSLNSTRATQQQRVWSRSSASGVDTTTDQVSRAIHEVRTMTRARHSLAPRW